tara:strand:- start:124 stop:525 length:402 start_codon:yes stop_codon:yes gene_type:complete
MRLDPLRRSVTDLPVDKLLEAIELIRNFDTTNGSHEISISVIATLLYVGSRNDCHKQALEEDLPLMTRASTSRNTDMLAKHHRIVFPSGKRKPGLGLIKKEVDVADRRRSVLTLTKKGEKLFTKIKEVLYGET